MDLEARVKKLEERLAKYERVYGMDVDRKVRELDRELEKFRLEYTPDEELSETDLLRKNLNRHFEQERQRIQAHLLKLRITPPHLL